MSTSGRHVVDYPARLARMAWNRRLETGLTLATAVARVALVPILGLGRADALLALGAFALVAWPTSRTWLVDRYRAERRARRWGKAFDAAGVDPAVQPRVVDEHPTPAGVVVDVALSPHLTATDLDTIRERLAVAFDATSVRVRPDATRAGRAQLVVATRDPLAGAAIPWPWIGLRRADLWSGLPLGIDEDDGLVVLDLAGHHVLLGGEPGAGKSNALSLVVGAAALDPTVELWCFDGKLVELAAWKRCCRRFVGPDLAEAVDVLRELRAEMESRFAEVLERGIRKFDETSGVGMIVVVIDELALYLQGKSKERDELADLLRDVVARGRAAGIVVVAATQKPAADVVPTSIRDLFGVRLALRCATRDASDTVLGVGWASRGYSASDVDPALRGVGYLLAEGVLPRRMRCFILDDDHLRHVARQAEIGRGTAR